MSHNSSHEASSEPKATDFKTIENAFLSAAYQAEISRRGALKALMAAAGTAVLFGMPKKAFAARASQETLDALASAEAQLDAVQAQLSQLGDEFQALSVKQNETIAQIEGVQEEIDATQQQIEEKQAELEEKQGILSERVSDSYKKGPLSTLNLLLASESFDELISNSRYVDKVNDADRKMIKEIQEIRAALEEQKAELETQKAALEQLKDEQASRLAEMQAKQAEISKVLSGLSQEVKDLIAKRDAEYLAAVQEEERQRQEAAAANRNPGGNRVPVNGSLSGATKSLERVLSSCHATPSPGQGLCAMWVSRVFYNAGFSYAGGNANDMYNAWCGSSNRDALKPGMIVATPSHPHTAAGRVYGHVGIYVGNGTVMDNIGYVNSQSLDSWCSYYGATVTVRWGWLNGWQLA